MTVLTDKIAALAKELDLGDVFEVHRIKHQNDIGRIVTSQGVFFCKIYTKHWYGRPEENPYPVMHEAGAYAALKANGLSTPEVVRAELSADNPLGMPFLLLRALEGETMGSHFAKGNNIGPLLEATGRYLKAMHGIVFKYPGYVTTPEGPSQPPDPRYYHIHWVATTLEKKAKKRWDDNSQTLGPHLHKELLHLFEKHREALVAGYHPPRMMHGDCHVDQFFFRDKLVTGVVDMEVASSGAPLGDLVKFAIEASSKLSRTNWWEPLFHGYAEEPSFDIFKLRLLCCEHAEFECQRWRGSYVEIITRLMAARSWAELFGCAGIQQLPGKCENFPDTKRRS